MKSIKRTEIYNAPAEMVFSYLDDFSVAGIHMTQSSAMVMGSEVHHLVLADHHGSSFMITPFLLY